MAHGISQGISIPQQRTHQDHHSHILVDVLGGLSPTWALHSSADLQGAPVV